MDDMLSELLSSVEGTLQKPVCFTLTPFDARSEVVRTKETGLGNWVADVLMHAYAESLIEGGHQAAAENDEMRKRKGGADAVIICGGTLRGDSQYGPGKITLGDILGKCLHTFFRP
jgi:5'-nucleotidase